MTACAVAGLVIAIRTVRLPSHRSHQAKFVQRLGRRRRERDALSENSIIAEARRPPSSTQGWRRKRASGASQALCRLLPLHSIP